MGGKKISSLAERRAEDMTGSDEFALAKGGVNEKMTADQLFGYIKGKPFNLVWTILDAVYPIGSLYVSAEDGECPLEFSGVMHWEEISEGVCVQGASPDQTPGQVLSPGLPQILQDNQLSAELDAKSLDHTHRISDPGHMHGIDGVNARTGKIHHINDNRNVPEGSGNTSTERTGINLDFSEYGDFNIDTEDRIYGKSDTVQPPAFAVKIFKRVS